jgi:hypothetical protein
MPKLLVAPGFRRTRPGSERPLEAVFKGEIIAARPANGERENKAIVGKKAIEVLRRCLFLYTG